VDATIAISGVTSEHIQIVVTLNGSNATVDSMNRVQVGDHAEVEGLITSISYGDRSMKVAGLMHPSGLFTEFRVGFMDSPRFRFGAGYAFRAMKARPSGRTRRR
jgi:hypothetical protein